MFLAALHRIDLRISLIRASLSTFSSESIHVDKIGLCYVIRFKISCGSIYLHLGNLTSPNLGVPWQASGSLGL